MDISAFKGLNNVTDPLRLGMEWLAQADNVNISDTGALSKRDGYALAKAGNFSAAFTTPEHERTFFVVDGVLQDFAGVALASVDATRPMFWAEVNGVVYFNNGVDSGTIAPDNTVGLWRGAPTSYGAGFKGDDGQDLEVLYGTLPADTGAIQHWRGRMYAAQYFASENLSVVWFSEPLGFHLFNLDSNFFSVPGEVTMLAPHSDALIVGTSEAVHAYTPERLVALAGYGVPPGEHWATDDTRVLFWTARGLCAALPFENLTDEQISVAAGIRAGGCLIESGGQKRYLTSLQQGGAPFNAL